MTSKRLPVAAAIKTVNVSSDSDDSDDESPVPVSQVRRRMPMCLKASEIDGKTSKENHIYTSKFLNYRKKRLQYIGNEKLLEDENNCDIEEEEESIFSNNKKIPLHSTHTRKILCVEKHVDDIINSVAVVPKAPVQPDPYYEVPLVTRISDGTASILKEFEAATSILSDPVISCYSESNTSIDSVECLYVDEVSREVSVKVRWRSSIKRYPMKNLDPFSTLISKVAKEIGANMSDILLSLNDMTIKHSDTPDSINLSVIDIIDCYVIKMIAEIVDDSVIELKLQSENRWKKVVKIHKDSPMGTLMEQCASEKGIPVDKVVFKFDGEVIDPSESPSDLDLESGLCIDVTFLT